MVLISQLFIINYSLAVPLFLLLVGLRTHGIVFQLVQKRTKLLVRLLQEDIKFYGNKAKNQNQS